MNYLYLLIYKEDVGRYNILVITRSLTYTIGVILVLLFFDRGLNSLIFVSIFSVFIGLLFGIYIFSVYRIQRSKFNFQLIKEIFLYSLNLYFIGIIGHFNQYLSRQLVVMYLNPSNVAFYGMAQNLILHLQKIPTAINQIIFSRVSKLSDLKDSANLVAKAFRIILVVLICISFLIVPFIKCLIILLYGQDYLPVAESFLIILPGAILFLSSSIISQYFYGVGRANIMAVLSIPPLIIQIFLAIELIPEYGLIGAALSYLITIIIYSIMQILLFNLYSPCTIMGDLLPRKEDIKILYNFIYNIINNYMNQIFAFYKRE